MSMKITDHYQRWQFMCRLKCARKAPNLTERELAFLDDLKKRFGQYGANMFLSAKKRDFLQSLAFSGGWTGEMDREPDSNAGQTLCAAG
jgi:hypothetical protein